VASSTQNTLTNHPHSYGWVSIFIHWFSALTAIGLFAVGWYMVELTYYDPLYHTLPQWHKAFGLLLALITGLRCVWLLYSHPPTLQASQAWVNAMVRAAHGLLYLALLVLFVSGYLITTADGASIELFGWIYVPALMELPPEQTDLLGDIHEWVAYFLMGLAAGHGGAALFHHVVMKDDTLKRMIKPTHPPLPGSSVSESKS